MFNIADEGEPLKNGFNFYPLTSSSSIGFKFLYNKTVYIFRYSKVTNSPIIKRYRIE